MKYICTICNWVYDEFSEEIPFDKLPEDYQCPECGAGKDKFEEIN